MIQLEAVRQHIQALAEGYQRDHNTVHLLAVSKKQSLDKIQHAIDLGQTHFGESYVQEALTKIQHFQNQPLTWHFIGPIQSNKTKDIATYFDWVHSVDRLKVIQRLNDQRPNNKPPLNILIQVNIDEDENKSGCLPEQAGALIAVALSCKHLKLQGLMTILKADTCFEEQRHSFARLRQLRDTLAKQHQITLPHLSMGMSQDLDAAIAEGATWVRVGSALFGQRSS